MPHLTPETRDKLKTVSTATLCTALYKRGLRNQFIQDVHPLNPNGAPMVGEAFTLRYIPAREDLNPLSAFQDRAHPQRKAVEECPPGAVFVIDSRKDARAASAGSILVSRLMVRGVAGVVTDGGFRDVPRADGSAPRPFELLGAPSRTERTQLGRRRRGSAPATGRPSAGCNRRAAPGARPPAREPGAAGRRTARGRRP